LIGGIRRLLHGIEDHCCSNRSPADLDLDVCITRRGSSLHVEAGNADGMQFASPTSQIGESDLCNDSLTVIPLPGVRDDYSRIGLLVFVLVNGMMKLLRAS
jgi:hypothetical protein